MTGTAGYGHTATLLRANGYQPIPCAGKIPLLPNWRASTDPSLDVNYPDCNVGLVTGGLVGLDIDIDDVHAVQVTRQTLLNSGLWSGLRRRGRAPRLLLAYRTSDPFPKLSIKFTDPRGIPQGVEVLCDGQQFIAFGDHPTTGRPYEWANASPLNTPLNTLPLVIVAQMREALDAIAARLVAECGYRVTSQGVAGGGIERLVAPLPPFDAPAPPEVRDALRWCSPHGWDTTVAVGMALKAAGEDWAEETFKAWARLSDRRASNPDPETWYQTRWDSFHPTHISLAAISSAAGVPGFASLDFATDPDAEVPQAPKPVNLMHPLGSGGISLPRWVIDGWLEEKATGLLWGESNTYKSFQSIDWAMSVAHGAPWRGAKTTRAPIWLIAGEGERGLRRRVAAWNRVHGFADDAYGAGVLVSAGALALQDPSICAALIAQGLSFAPGLIVIDTLSRNFRGDENAQGEVRDLIDNVTRLGQRLGATVLIVHHAKKDGSTYRGSTALKANVDFEYEQARQSKDIALLRCHKMKDADEPNPTASRARVVKLAVVADQWGDPKDVTSLVLDPVDIVEIQAEQAAGLAAAVDDAYAELGPTATANSIYAHVGGRKAQVLAAVKGRKIPPV